MADARSTPRIVLGDAKRPKISITDTDRAKVYRVREIREELGVEIDVGELFAEIRHDYPEKSVHLKFFRCTLPHGEPQPLDCAAVKWITLAELDAYAFPAADAQLLAQLKADAK
jgi:mutator protein MutT